jgi:DNA primase small subunit
MKEKVFLKKKFREYYSTLNVEEIKIISLKNREFGFVLFEESGMIRHKAFDNINKLIEFLREYSPAHAYYSSAYYEYPSVENMNEKKWIGADLIFDVDVDHISTSCKDKHDKWRCLDCGNTGMGAEPKTCSICGSKRIESKKLVCQKCLEIAKTEITKLVDDFLLNDFGFKLKDIEIVFSGHRGYHVHVFSKDVLMLDQNARREIIDYVRGRGIDVYFLFGGRSNNEIISYGPSINEPGWLGRWSRGLYDYIISMKGKMKEEMELPEKLSSLLIKNMDRIIESYLTNNKPLLSPLALSLKSRNLKIFVEKIAEEYSVKIDEQVTLDVKRLIRIPNTLHGKTGLKAVIVKYDLLDSFNPLIDAIVFRDGKITVKVHESPEIYMFNKEFGPYRDQVVDLPLYVAVYLIGQQSAELLS